MKKIILFNCILLLLSGCKSGESTAFITCTDDSLSAKIELNGDNIKSITAVAEFETSELADTMCPIIKTTVKGKSKIICDGKRVIIEDYQDSIELESNTKEGAIKYFEDKGYTCK